MTIVTPVTFTHAVNLAPTTAHYKYLLGVQSQFVWWHWHCWRCELAPSTSDGNVLQSRCARRMFLDSFQRFNVQCQTSISRKLLSKVRQRRLKCTVQLVKLLCISAQIRRISQLSQSFTTHCSLLFRRPVNALTFSTVNSSQVSLISLRHLVVTVCTCGRISRQQLHDVRVNTKVRTVTVTVHQIIPAIARLLEASTKVLTWPMMASPVLTRAGRHTRLEPEIDSVRVARVGAVYSENAISTGRYVAVRKWLCCCPSLTHMLHELARPIVKESRQRRVVLSKSVGEANVQLYIPAHDYHKCIELTYSVFYVKDFLFVLLSAVMFHRLHLLTTDSDSHCNVSVPVSRHSW